MGAPQITFVENTPWKNTLQGRALSSMCIREVLALNVRRYRHAAKLSQEELAHRAEIDRTYISAIERCIYAASIDVVDRLARGLGVEAADLLRRPPAQERTAGPQLAAAKPQVRSRGKLAESDLGKGKPQRSSSSRSR
jgi:transcriptional regulator with XRE-family HTH domain